MLTLAQAMLRRLLKFCLSACNTAAGDRDGTEAFSGLARAFFYAGARSVLVSHWYVDSVATVQLVTGVFNEIRSDPSIGRSEALRRAISGLIARGGRYASCQLGAIRGRGRGRELTATL